MSAAHANTSLTAWTQRADVRDLARRGITVKSPVNSFGFLINDMVMCISFERGALLAKEEDVLLEESVAFDKLLTIRAGIEPSVVSLEFSSTTWNAVATRYMIAAFRVLSSVDKIKLTGIECEDKDARGGLLSAIYSDVIRPRLKVFTLYGCKNLIRAPHYPLLGSIVRDGVLEKLYISHTLSGETGAWEVLVKDYFAKSTTLKAAIFAIPQLTPSAYYAILERMKECKTLNILQVSDPTKMGYIDDERSHMAAKELLDTNHGLFGYMSKGVFDHVWNKEQTKHELMLHYRAPRIHQLLRTRVMCQAGRARAATAGVRGETIVWVCERAPLWVVVHVCALLQDIDDDMEEAFAGISSGTWRKYASNDRR